MRAIRAAGGNASDQFVPVGLGIRLGVLHEP